jgi:hypothetical protein
MKKKIKTIIIYCISCIVILIALPVFIIARSTLNKGVYLLYNEEDHTLLIENRESAKYIRKIVVDLHRDTLSVNVYKKGIFIKPTSIINSAGTKWKIKLQPNVGFVKLGNKVTPLPEMEKYPDKDIIYIYYPAIEVYPQKFPYICE